jgi:hypothetical protein
MLPFFCFICETLCVYNTTLTMKPLCEYDFVTVDNGILGDFRSYCPRCSLSIERQYLNLDNAGGCIYCPGCGLIFNLGCMMEDRYYQTDYHAIVYLRDHGVVYESEKGATSFPVHVLDDIRKMNVRCLCTEHMIYFCSAPPSWPTTKKQCPHKECDCLKIKGQITLLIHLIHQKSLPIDLLKELKYNYLSGIEWTC